MVQTLREVLEEFSKRNDARPIRTSSEIRTSEEAFQVLQQVPVRQDQRARVAEETSERVRLRGWREIQISGMCETSPSGTGSGDHGFNVPGAHGIGSSPVESQRPRQYRQRTRITGINPMDMPEAAARIARMHKSMRMAHGRHITVYRPAEYRQRTEITGKDPLNVPGDAGQGTSECEHYENSQNANQILAVGELEGDLLDPTRMAQDNRESVFYRALGSVERARLFDPSIMSDQVNELRTNIRIRTLKEIFKATQRRHDDEGSGPWPLRKRAQLSLNQQLREGGVQEPPQKRIRRENNRAGKDPRRDVSQKAEVEVIMRALEKEFEEKERQSSESRWCEPIPHERKVATVCEFYKAFHDSRTLPIQTCMICYRKFAIIELEEFESTQSMLPDLRAQYGSQFGCRKCFASDKNALGCVECIRNLEKGALSPAAHVHNWLRCEHAYPDELKDLSPVEEKLIALNTCYGFIAKYDVAKGHRETATYPKHVKGHITVFPNNVQELVTRVLPHPLLKVMDEIHVSWQGVEKPAPKDLSALLSVRRRVVERALLWLKQNNPHYASIEIDTMEMESWGAPSHGVPSQVYERLERDEPSAEEKTRTAQLVPPTERGHEAGEGMDVREILATLNQPQEVRHVEIEERGCVTGDGISEVDPDVNRGGETVQEISASGMFALDSLPNVHDTEKLRYLYDALGCKPALMENRPSRTTTSLGVQSGSTSEPYIVVSRGEDFADSKDVWFFAKTFPTLFPFGGGGPRQVEENMSDTIGHVHVDVSLVGETMVKSAVSSRNLSLESWARAVLQRHGGRFATHRVFTFLVFNMLVRYRNHQVSMMSVARKEFPEVERVVRSLSAERIGRARDELLDAGKTSDRDVNQLLRSLSLYGFRQPMSRELRLGMRRKIKSLIVRDGIPAIWFTLNPNDITNPTKLRLAAYRTHNPEQAEAFLTSLDLSYKRMRLAISDPLSSAIFFHREISMFFKYYVKVGEPSVFGRINQYFGAVETNERGALHLHGLLWLHGNTGLSSLWEDIEGEDKSSYREKIVQYVDSVFTEELDQEASCAIAIERAVTSDISSMLQNKEQFSAAFEEEANFCAGGTQIHTHSPTCVKYSINRPARMRNLCRFRAPWRIVEKTGFNKSGVLEIRRNHNMVNRWNKAIAVGLRHNHDISFIGTQSKTLAIVFYVTNYATKLEDPVWKRAAAAAEVLTASADSESVTGSENRTRQFMARVANRVFTERALSQVEVAAHLMGFGMEFTHTKTWTYLNVSSLYWEIFRRWDHLRYSAGEENEEPIDEAVILEYSGQRATFIQAYPHRGPILAALSLYDYMSVVKFKRKCGGSGNRGDLEFEESWPLSKTWVQILRKRDEFAVICLDGYLSMDFGEEDEQYHRRAAVQHLAMFVPWENYLSDSSGDINAIWERQAEFLPRRLAAVTRNILLLQRSAEDAKRDARQWAAQSMEADPATDEIDAVTSEGEEEGYSRRLYRSDDSGSAMRLIDVLRSMTGSNQVTAGSDEVKLMVQRLCEYQQAALCSTEDTLVALDHERDTRTMSTPEGTYAEGQLPNQAKVSSIKSQQASASRERERMIQGIQEQAYANAGSQDAATYRVLSGFGEDNLNIIPPDLEAGMRNREPSTSLRLGSSSSFFEAAKQMTESLTLNRRQSIALQLLCRHLDRVHGGESNVPQLCQFIGGQGGTGKSRIIEAVVALFASKGMSNRLLVTATSGTAAARINGITIHAACNVSVDSSRAAFSSGSSQMGATSRTTSLRVDGQRQMDWQDKDMLIIDEISMLGARTLHAVNEQLCIFRGCTQDFGGIPIVLFLGDFRQFRPVQERSILVPSSDFLWDNNKTFRVEQRHQHDKAHMLWKRFTTVVMLDEQVRAAGDVQLQRLLTRIRMGLADQSDVDLLNRTCYQEGRRIPWESGITVVTPLNRHRWNWNIEGTLSFWKQHDAQLQIFVSEHKWKSAQPTEEEALMIMGYGDDSSVPVPAIFMFVPGMPVVANRNTYPGLKLVNGSTYKALDVVLDKAYTGHRISSNITLYFGPPAGIILAAESTKSFNFVGMPPGTILLTPLSSKIECVRRRPWQQHDVTRRGLPCTAAFACTDYKVQGRTLEQVALELRGTRTLHIGGQAVPSQCDPYSLYVQLSRSTSLQGIMLLSKVRERDIICNTVPENMVKAEERLEELSKATIQEAEAWNRSF